MPASTGYGEPIQRLFKLKDGEKIVAALSLDPRVDRRHHAVDEDGRRRRRCTPSRSRATATRCASASSRFVEPSTRAGRRYARPAEGAEVVGVARLTGGEILIAATAEARGLLCKADEVNFLSGPGQGRHPDQAGRRRPGARVHRLDRRPRPADGRDHAAAPSRPSAPAKYEVTGRGGKGRELLQRGQFTRVVWPTPEAPPPLDARLETRHGFDAAARSTMAAAASP